MIRKKRARLWLHKTKQALATGAFSAFVGNTTAYIFAAPILVWWGMPQSNMSIVGNIVFAPFLALFILLCVLMLGFSLFGHIPQIVSAPLERLTLFWLKCLSKGSFNFLYGQQNHPIIFIGLMMVVGITSWQIIKSASKKQLAINLLIGYLTTTALLLIPLTTNSSTLKNRCGSLHIAQNNASWVDVRDTGYLTGLRSPEKNIPFQVKRHLMQNHGALTINHLELLKLNANTLRAVNELMIATHIKKLTLPHITTPQTPFFWRQLSLLRKIARNNTIQISYEKKPSPDKIKPQNYVEYSQNHQPQIQAAAE